MQNPINVPTNSRVAIDEDTCGMPAPLTPPRRVELWGGRLAMVGFTATVAAIAISHSL